MGERKLVTPRECCLHIVDPQKSLMAQIHQADRVTKVIQLMIECAGILELPTIASTQYFKGLGPYVDELENMMGGLTRIDKKEFSAYKNSETLGHFKKISEKISTVILVGVETHICIYQSAMALLEMGLRPWIVADGVSSRTLENHELGLARLRQEGAVIGPAEMIIYELLGQAGTPEFKAILPHIIAFNK